MVWGSEYKKQSGLVGDPVTTDWALFINVIRKRRAQGHYTQVGAGIALQHALCRSLDVFWFVQCVIHHVWYLKRIQCLKKITRNFYMVLTKSLITSMRFFYGFVKVYSLFYNIFVFHTQKYVGMYYLLYACEIESECRVLVVLVLNFQHTIQQI